MTKLEGGLKTNIIDAGVAYGKIVMRIILLYLHYHTFSNTFICNDVKKNKNEMRELVE